MAGASLWMTRSWSVQESNLRTPGLQSGATPSQLTDREGATATILACGLCVDRAFACVRVPGLEPEMFGWKPNVLPLTPHPRNDVSCPYGSRLYDGDISGPYGIRTRALCRDKAASWA